MEPLQYAWKAGWSRPVATALASLCLAGPAVAAALDGQVLGAGAPIVNATVTLWQAGSGAPRQLAQVRSGADGRFALAAPDAPLAEGSLYLLAKGGTSAAGKGSGDNPAIALLTVLGVKAPAKVTINEMTTVASVWTHNQFIDGDAIKGQPLQLKIAAGNVPSFVDLHTGGWGSVIQDPLNSSQTPTMANFATLASVLAGCVTRVLPEACQTVFLAAQGPSGGTPTDTLRAAHAIARAPWYQPNRLFRALEAFYPVPQGKTMRAVPYMPYLQWTPSAWVLPLKVTGGGYRAGGKAMFDSRGQPLGRQQLHGGLAGAGQPVAGQRQQVRRQRQAAVADDHRLLPAAACRAAPSAPPSMPRTTRGSPATAARRSPCSTRTASR